MVIFKSKQPDIDLPRDITIWDWLFDSPWSPLSRHADADVASYVDAATKDSINYRQVKEASTHISTALAANYGLKPHETVSLFSRNTIWYPVMMLSVVRLGAMVSGASPAYTVDEMVYALKTAGARFLATSPSSIGVAEKAAAEAGIPKSHIFLLEGQLPGYTTIQDLIRMGRDAPRQAPAYKIPAGKRNGDVCAFLSFSSGTTGLPKAVMIAHQNVIAQCLQIQQITPETHKKVLACLPLFHITGLVHQMHLPILLNASVYMLPAFSMQAMCETVREYQIEEVLLVPPIVIRLVRDPVVDRYDLSCIRRFSSGAAPLSDEILQQLRQKFPGTGFKQGYGMTESCSCLTAHPPALYDFRYAHSVGTICASTELKILREDGSEGGVGDAGEILGRGPQCVMGYLNNDKATRETFDAEGWLHTGDQGRVDGEGVVHILDRIKEMIKVKGIGVAPAELEDLLLGHEAVEDCAVMGVADDYSGERPKAFVVLKSAAAGAGAGESRQEVGRRLIQYVSDKKVRHKWIKEVELVDEIPKSASGKILRRVLRDQAKGGSTGMVVRAVERAKL